LTEAIGIAKRALEKIPELQMPKAGSASPVVIAARLNVCRKIIQSTRRLANPGETLARWFEAAIVLLDTMIANTGVGEKEAKLRSQLEKLI
jgi:hypothetical protein